MEIRYITLLHDKNIVGYQLVDENKTPIGIMQNVPEELVSGICDRVNTYDDLVNIARQFVQGFDSGENLRKAKHLLDYLEANP